jgi:DNA-binding NarL/FixJ family response regulator
LIVDDHKMFVEGLSQLLTGRFDIVGSIGDGSLLVDAAARLRPDVIILDVSMPQMSGIEALRPLRARQPDARAIVLTMHADPHLARAALKAGAAGVMLKESTGDELLTALETVLQGRTYLTAALTKDVLAIMSEPSEPTAVTLSARQRDVLRLLVEGRRVKEIAAALDLSPRSVESIKYQMMQELNLDSTAGLVRYALQHRLLL